ncbi:site-specific DNA-methyltransferase [Brevundimonas sp.]|jgi:adenine-specific DNA-methyltransferase|uniref:site-specific DNA-methyltransferase n=1 Tax=Brevundimonas sp. TaxID=1871086 RepID=UPI00391AAEA5
MSEDGHGPYAGLSREQLIQLLAKRDRQKKLGLVWERDEIEADRALEAEFAAADLIADLSDPAASFDGWPNLVIEGDNWDALRWLRMTMAGRVKCIYVDPPYNTGAKDWVYNDHYVAKEDRWRHSTWLEFLYRRFALARDLLTEDGVILISINDENRAKLELMLDEVLPGMRVGSLVWRTRTGSNADQGQFLSADHEHILVYANVGFSFGGLSKSYATYSNPDNDPRGDWAKDNLTLGFDRFERPNLFYPLHDPTADVWYPCNPDRVWVYATEARVRAGQTLQTRTIEEFIADNRVVFPEDQRIKTWASIEELIEAIRRGDVPRRGRTPLLREDLPDLEFWVGRKVAFGAPRFKRFKADLRNDTQPLSSWMTPRSEVAETERGDAKMLVTGTNDEGSKAIRSIFGSKAFNYPKPPSLIRGLLEQATSPSDLVLDFFAGSATTAQAVMQLNAEDGGDRRFVMVSSTEATDEDPDKNLCRTVTAERVRRLNASDDPAYAALNAPFAYLRMSRLRFEDLDYDLSPAQAWTALEALHGLPLTPHDTGAPWCEHETDEVVLILVERVDPALVERLQTLSARRAPAFVYAWAPGQITAATGPLEIEVRPVRETLVARFRAQ